MNTAAGSDARTDWPAVAAAVACGVAVAFNIGKVPITLGVLRQEFGLSMVAAGWVASLLNTLSVFAAVFFGMAGDRLGHLRLVAAGLAFSVAGALAGMLAERSALLLISRCIEGVGFLCVVVAAPALVSKAARAADRHLALGIWAAYMPAGAGLAMLAAPLILPLGGWRGLWAVCLCALVMAAWMLHLRRRSYASATGAEAPFSLRVTGAPLARGEPWLYGLAMCSWTVQQFALIVWLPTFLREQRGLESAAVALLSAGMVVANVPGNLLAGWLAQRGARRGTLIAWASACCGVLDLLIYLDALSDLPRYLCCVALSLVGGLIPAAVMSSSATLATGPRQVGTLQGLFIQCAHFGQFVGPPLIAFVVARSGQWHDALAVTAGAALAGLAAGLLARYSCERPRGAAGEPAAPILRSL